MLKGLLGKTEPKKHERRKMAQPAIQAADHKQLFTTVWNLRREGNEERVVSRLIALNPSRSKKIQEEIEEQPSSAAILGSIPSIAYHLAAVGVGGPLCKD